MSCDAQMSPIFILSGGEGHLYYGFAAGKNQLRPDLAPDSGNEAVQTSERIKDRAIIWLTGLFANMHQDIVQKFCGCLEAKIELRKSQD